jgi:hypothetical protein
LNLPHYDLVVKRQEIRIRNVVVAIVGTHLG